MLFELARSVFHMPVGEMLQRVSQCELMYWLMLQSIDPAGEGRSDLRHAISTSALVNMQIQKRRDKTKPKDFMAGVLLRKQHKRDAARRGLVPEWDGKAFWRNLMNVVKRN